MSAHSTSGSPGVLAMPDALKQLNAANLELAKHANDMQQKLRDMRLDHANNCVAYESSHTNYLKLHTIIRACEQETAKLRVANAVLKENHNGIKSKVAQLEAELARKTIEATTAEDSGLMMQRNIDELTAQQQKLYDQIHSAKHQKESIFDQNSKVGQRLQGLQDNISSLHAMLASVSQECKQGALSLQEQLTAEDRETARLNTLTAQFEAAKAKRAQLDTTIASMRERVSELAGRVATVQVERAQAVESATAAHTTIAQLQSSIDTKLEEVASLERNLRSLSLDSQLVQERVERLQHSLRTESDKAVALQQQKESAATSLQEMRQQLSDMHQHFESQQQLVSSLSREKGRLESQIEGTNHSSEDKRRAISEAAMTSSKLTASMTELTRLLQQHKEEYAATCAELEYKQRQIAQLRAQETQVKEEITHIQSENVSKRSHLAAVTTASRNNAMEASVGEKRKRRVAFAESTDQPKEASDVLTPAKRLRKVSAAESSLFGHTTAGGSPLFMDATHGKASPPVSPAATVASQDTQVLVAERYNYPIMESRKGEYEDPFSVLYGSQFKPIGKQAPAPRKQLFPAPVAPSAAAVAPQPLLQIKAVLNAALPPAGASTKMKRANLTAVKFSSHRDDPLSWLLE